MVKSVSTEQLWGRKEEILQSGNRDHNSRDANGELLQQQREARIDLGINGKVSTLAVARRLVVIQLEDNFLPQNVS